MLFHMPDHAQVAELWTLEERIGRMHRGALAAQVDLTHPHLGLHEIRWEAAPLRGRLLALTPSNADSLWPAKLADAYVRGQDLIATFAGTDDWPYAPQVYWSIEPAGSRDAVLAALSLVVSVQTNLLDTHPHIDVSSRLPADELLCLSLVGDDVRVAAQIAREPAIDPRARARGLLWRLPGGRLSYAEITPASDFHQLSVIRHESGEFQSRWELFAEFLEKGVIRRARLHSLFLPRENDVQLAAESCRTLQSRPLPLTT